MLEYLGHAPVRMGSCGLTFRKPFESTLIDFFHRGFGSKLRQGVWMLFVNGYASSPMQPPRTLANGRAFLRTAQAALYPSLEVCRAQQAAEKTLCFFDTLFPADVWPFLLKKPGFWGAWGSPEAAFAVSRDTSTLAPSQRNRISFAHAFQIVSRDHKSIEPVHPPQSSQLDLFELPIPISTSRRPARSACVSFD